MGQASSSTASEADGDCLASSFDNYLKNFKLETQILSEETRTLIQCSLRTGDVGKATSLVSSALKDIENAPLSIAVTGEGGAGKSTLTNALRGVEHEEKGAAATGPTETTMNTKEYKHPQFPSVSLWDLPGTGTTKFPPETYPERVRLAEYDFLLIVSATRFKYIDAQLAKVIQKMKKFYFVRTKIDNDLHNERKAKPTTFKEKEVLRKCEKIV